MATILFLGANPSSTTRLALDAEVREIAQRLVKSEHRDDLRLVQEWAISIEDLHEHMLRHRPAIVHFSGHGSSAGQLVIDDGAGRAVPLDRGAVSDLFRILRKEVRCVVLNACFSEEQANGIAEHIDCVVGMSAAVKDGVSLAFAGAFYQAIGFGESVQTAFDLGKNKMALGALGQAEVPQLVVRTGVSAADVVIARAAPRAPAGPVYKGSVEVDEVREGLVVGVHDNVAGGGEVSGTARAKIASGGEIAGVVIGEVGAPKADRVKAPMFCSECGEKVVATAKFCANCGARIGPGAAPAAAPAAVAPAAPPAPAAPAKSVVVSGDVRAENVSGGDVAGVRVEQVSAEKVQFQANVIQVKLSDEQVALLARAQALPTEVQTPSSVEKISQVAGDLSAMRRSVDEVLARMAQAEAQGRVAQAAQAGDVRVRRTDLLVKKAILLETEAQEMVFDQGRKWREAQERRGGMGQRGGAQIDLADFFGGIDQKEYSRKLAEAHALFEEASRLEPANTEILLHLYQISGTIGADARTREQILYRIGSLLRDPKNDMERFHLAQAMFLGAASQEPVQIEQIRTARGMFERLGRADWVKLCDEHLSPAQNARGGGGGMAGGGMASGGMAPHGTAPAGFGGPAFKPVGAWRVADSVGGILVVELRADGQLQGGYQAGPLANAQIGGRWGFDAVRQLLQIQAVLNGYMPLANVIAIRGMQGGMYVGEDGNGMMFYLQRLM